MRILMPLIAAVFLTACAKSNDQGIGYNQDGIGQSSSANGGDPSSFAGAGFSSNQQSLTHCIQIKSALGGTVPSLASSILIRHGADVGQSQVKIGLDEVMAYTRTVLDASGGSSLGAAELISKHEAADGSCFREQIRSWSRKASDPASADTVKSLRAAYSSLGRVYSTLKTMTATGDVADLSERLARSYVPVGLRLPAAVL